MSDAINFDPITAIAGTATDAFNGLTGLGFGIYDRVTQAKNQVYQARIDARNFAEQKRLNEQAQANYERNFAFQEAQANQQQENFNKVFEANRIGNLMKEYKEAGINPAAAAGMGASTASAGVVGGTSAPNSRTGGAQVSGVGTHPINELHLNNTMAMLNYQMQKKLNDAQVGNIDADTKLKEAQAKNESEYKPILTEAQISEINKSIEKTIQDIAESKAREKHTDAITEQIKLENEVISLEAMKKHAESDIWNTMLDNLTEKQKKKLSKKAYKSLQAQVSQMATDEKYKQSQTFATYNDAICKDAQTLINAYSAITTGTQGAQQIQLNEKSIQNQMRRTEQVNFYYDKNGARHYTSGYERR